MSLTDSITDTIKDALPKIKENLPKMPILADSGHAPNVGSAEREVSLAAGVLLALVLWRRGGWLLAGAAVGAVAASLVYRGATGYCPINKAMGRDSTTDDAPAPPKLDLVQA